MHSRSIRFFSYLVLLASLAACANSSDEPRSAAADCQVVPPEEPVACTMQYDPVCGCDGKTYSNACVARAKGVPRSTPGACEDNRYD